MNPLSPEPSCRVCGSRAHDTGNPCEGASAEPGGAAPEAICATPCDHRDVLPCGCSARKSGGGGAPAAGEREALALALRKSARAYHHEMHRLSDPQNTEFESCSSPVCQDAAAALRAPAPPTPPPAAA